MQFLQADEKLQEQFAADIPELVHATGPVSYDYHFPKRAIFDALVTHSWRTPGTLFSAATTRLAIDEGKLLGIEIGFHGIEYRERIAALNPAWAELLASGIANQADVQEVVENSDHASWLNPAIAEGTYYVHALSVKPEAGVSGLVCSFYPMRWNPPGNRGLASCNWMYCQTTLP